MTDYSFVLRKMAADGQGYFSEGDRLHLINAADRIRELEAALKLFADDYVDAMHRLEDHDGIYVKVGDLRQARKVLGEKE